MKTPDEIVKDIVREMGIKWLERHLCLYCSVSGRKFNSRLHRGLPPLSAANAHAPPFAPPRG
jgi:hypothetical protein